MIQVIIDSVRVSLMSPQRVIVLRELDGDRFLPIWVGPYEAEAISVALQELEMARPLTHDLLKDVITIFGAKVMRVEINSLRENIFYGMIVTERQGEVIRIDSRPSDAIAIAVRTHAPIMVDPKVLENAGIFPEEDIQSGKGIDDTAADEHLSIFQDFFDQLDEKGDSDPEEPLP